MRQKRVLSVQDISCFGKCANTVALPVFSAAGIETVAVPTALLSTHTGGFTGYTFRDLTDEMTGILGHFRRLGLTFDMVYTGYFGSAEQMERFGADADFALADAFVLVDPVLGDRGSLYAGYDDRVVDAMRRHVARAHLITPNVTEACLLTGQPYLGDAYDEGYIRSLIDGLLRLGARGVVMTGICFPGDRIGVVTHTGATLSSRRVEAPLHGTGDVFASVLGAALLRGASVGDAAGQAVRFIDAAIEQTLALGRSHWYGLCFEPCLHLLTDPDAPHGSAG